MKNARYTAIALILALGAAPAFAQGAGEALTASHNDYYGTARTIAMGNAFTALGGDIGSLGINPAGGAVNNYSQVTITPGVTVYGANTTFDGNNSYHSNRGNFNLPNIGASFNMSTNRRSGLVGMSFGFVANSTGWYNKDFTGRGDNRESSSLGYLSDYATYYNLGTNALQNSGNLEYYSDLPAALAYQSLVMYPATANNGGPYISPVQENYGATGPYPMRGEIEQRYSYRTTGNKRDMVFNFGMNFSNRFFVGLNLGLVSLTYNESQTMREEAKTMADFPVTVIDRDGVSHSDHFSDMALGYNYRMNGTGVYGKIGIIAVPVEGLRLGLAVQTPTSLNARETRYFTINTNLIEEGTGFKDGATLETDDFRYEYKLILPARYNVGLAYTIGKVGLLSVDYELADYRKAKYKERYTSDNYNFDGSNSDVHDLLALAHNIRVGAEFKPVSQLAVRAGYNYSAVPRISNYGFGGNVAAAAQHLGYNAVSAGLGYSSRGSFFCDFAVRCKINPKEYYYPYPTYIEASPSPEIAVSSKMWDVILTLGLRF